MKNRIRNMRLFGLMLLLLIGFEAKSQLIVGDVAPDFTVYDMNGEEHNLYDYLDAGKYVMLKFGFHGCPSCDAQTPTYNALYRNFGCNQEDVVILQLSTLDDNEYYEDLFAEYSVPGPFGDPETWVSEDHMWIQPIREMMITTTGGADVAGDLFEFSSVTYEVIIDPVTREIVGCNQDDAHESSSYYGNSVLEGTGWGGYASSSLTTYLEDHFDDLFHYVDSWNIAEYLETNDLVHVISEVKRPFEEFCTGDLSECDTEKPEITSTEIEKDPESDSTYTITMNWDNVCDGPVVIKYKFGFDEPITYITTDEESFTLSGLYPGTYTIGVRCECNTIANYAYEQIKIEPETNFYANMDECLEVCTYRVLIHDEILTEVGAAYSTSENWLDADVRLRIESEGMVEYYTYSGGLNFVEYEGELILGEYYDVKFCKGSDINFQFYEYTSYFEEFGEFRFSLAPRGFKLINDAGEIVEEHTETIFPLDFPGYSAYGPIVSNCENPITTVGIEQNKSQKNDIRVYPVPFDEMITLEMENAEAGVFTLTDVLGKSIPLNTNYKSNGIVEIDMSSIPSGIYILNIRTGASSYTKRIIKN